MSDSQNHIMRRFRLNEIVRQFIDFRGRTPLKLGMEWGGGEVRALSANNVQMGRIDFSKEAYFASDALYQRWMTKGDCERGDVVLTTEAPLGNVAQIPDDEKYILSQRVILLKADKTKALPAYLLQLFQSEAFQSKLTRQSTGTTVLGIQQARLARIEVDLVPLSEQRRIAEILSTLDETIEQTEALIAKYQQIKAGLMHDLFTRGVTPDGKLRPTRAEAPQLYKESPLGWIPKEWEWDYLSNLTLKIVDGVHHTPEYVVHGIPFVTVKNLTACSGIDFTDLNHVTPADHAMFLKRADPQPGDVLVTKDGTLGISRIVEDQHPEFSIFVSVAQLRPIATRLRPWMLHCFFDSGAYERQLGRLSAGTGLKHIHLEHFRRFRIPLPSSLEQDAIAEIARSVELVLSTEEEHREELLKQKHGLMHDLLTGRVRVKATEQ